MLASEATSHTKSWHLPIAEPASVQSSEAFATSRTVASTRLPRARSCRTHSSPMPLLAPTTTQTAGVAIGCEILLAGVQTTKMPLGIQRLMLQATRARAVINYECLREKQNAVRNSESNSIDNTNLIITGWSTLS